MPGHYFTSEGYFTYSADFWFFYSEKGGVFMAGSKLREVNYAHGKADFIAKLQIALKECYETEYWLELFVKSEILDRDTVVGLYTQCGTIRRILIASINTAKENQKRNSSSPREKEL